MQQSSCLMGRPPLHQHDKKKYHINNDEMHDSTTSYFNEAAQQQTKKKNEYKCTDTHQTHLNETLFCLPEDVTHFYLHSASAESPVVMAHFNNAKEIHADKQRNL